MTVTLRPIDGGPSYYADNGFTAAAAAGWDEPSFFPIGQDYSFYPANDVATFKALGLNFTHRVTSSTDLSALREAGIWVIQGSGDTPTNGGSETVAGHMDEPGDWSDIQSAAALIAGWGLPGLFLHTAFTWNQIFYGTVSGVPGGNDTMPYVMGTGISTDGDVTLNVPAADIYWFAGSTITGGGGVPYEGGLIYNQASNLTADQCARGPHYGDMIDTMRGWLTTPASPAPVFCAYIETDNGLLSDPGARQITPPEWVWAVWSCVIHGARGIIYFSATSDYGDGSTFGFSTSVLSGQSVSMYDQAVITNAQLAALAPVINSEFAEGYFTVSPTPTILNGATPDSGIDAMAKYFTGGYGVTPGFYIFATTRESETAANISATFTTADQYSGPVTVVGEDRTVAATGGVFTDVFATGAAVHVYQLPPTADGMLMASGVV